MASIKNFGLIGVGSDVQYGKGGARIVQSEGFFRLRTADNQAFARLEVAATTASMSADTATSKGYVDALRDGLQSELDLSQASVGLQASGSLAAWTSGSYISAASSVVAAVNILDGALGSAVFALTAADGSLATRIGSAEARLTTAEARIGTLEGEMDQAQADITTLYALIEANSGSLQAELDLTQASIGLPASGSFAAPSGNYSAGATTVMSLISALDTALFNVDGNLSAVETAAGLASNGTLAPFAGADFLNAASLKAGIEQVSTYAAGVNTNVTAIETAVGLGADGTLTAFSGTMLGGATTVVGAINALRDAADGRLDAVETEAGRLNTTMTTNFIHRDGSVTMAAALQMGGNAILNLLPQSSTDETLGSNTAATIGYVQGRIAALAGAFQYEGLVELGANVGAAVNMDALLTAKDPGSYYKVSAAGYYTWAGNTTPQFANVNDGIVKNTSGSWDKIDNSDSTVAGTENFIAVSGSPDTGYTVDIHATFKDRMTQAEADINSLEVALGTTQVQIASIDARLVAADSAIQAELDATQLGVGLGTNGSYVAPSGSYISATTSVMGAIGTLDAVLASVNANLTAVETSSGLGTDGSLSWGTAASTLVSGTTTLRGAIEALSSAGSGAQAELDVTQASVGLNTDGTAPAFNATMVSGATTVIAAINQLATFADGRLVSAEGRLATVEARAGSLETRMTTAEGDIVAIEGSVGLNANGSLPTLTGSYIASSTTVVAALNALGNQLGTTQSEIDAEEVARAAADTALSTELDDTQTLIGFTSPSGSGTGTLVWASSAPTYVTNAATIKAAIEGTASALANLSQDEIRNATGDVRVKAGTSAIQMSVPGASGTLTAVEIVGGAAMNTSMELDFGTAGDIRFEAKGSGADVNFRFVPKGTGQVFIGDAGVAGAVQADVGQDLILAGGNNTGANTAGSLRLRPGDSATGTDGAVRVEAPAGGGTYTPVMLFNSASAATYFEVTAGSTAATLAAAGGANASIVLAPTGTGTVDASSKRITSVANPTLDTDAVNKGFMNTAISTAVTNASLGAVTTRVGTVSADGTVNLGTAVTGTVLRVKVLVTSAFTAGSLSVGRSGDTAELAANADLDLTQTGLYIVENAVDYTTTQLLATAAGLTGAGSAKVIVEFLQG